MFLLCEYLSIVPSFCLELRSDADKSQKNLCHSFDVLGIIASTIEMCIFNTSCLLKTISYRETPPLDIY